MEQLFALQSCVPLRNGSEIQDDLPIYAVKGMPSTMQPVDFVANIRLERTFVRETTE